MRTSEIVEGYLKAEGRCYGHCEGKTELAFLEKGGRLISCMACPGGYVSRIVMYSEEGADDGFRAFLNEKAGEIGEVKDADIRVATRHPWDLGLTSGSAGDVVIREAYWTQNYGRAKSEAPGRKALFLCRKCNELFVAPISDGASHAHTR